MSLTDKQIKAIKPEGKAKKYFDGGGMYLEVTASGNKMWRPKYRINGIEKRISLGPYSEWSWGLRHNARQAPSRFLDYFVSLDAPPELSGREHGAYVP